MDKRLKLNELLPIVKDRMKKGIKDKQEFVDCAKHLYHNAEYENYTVLLASIVKYGLFKSQELCNWQKQYNCNDNHITSLFVRALKDFVKEENIMLEYLI